MAEQEQVERLTCSIKEWNQWRQHYPDLHPDLSNTNFSGTDLNEANLSRTNLTNANLHRAILHSVDFSNANLSEANLSKADLYEANLHGAILHSVDLSNADLSEANLSEANLSRAFLRFADLTEAFLRFADLSEAFLSRASLVDTNLSNADFSNADLNKADLSNADLTEVNLSRANLSGANLSYTNLSSTNFTNILFSRTIFAWTDLSRVRGLNTARHGGPSSLDINSVILPHDEYTRTHFLRGVGFTEAQIEYLPSLLTPRITQYYSLFISYAHQDEIMVKRLYTDLRKNNVLCWFAPEDMKIGDNIRHRIDESIHRHDKLLLVLSEHSVASQWVEHEVETALSKEYEGKPNVLFPIRLDNAVMKSTTGWASHIRLTRHIGDFTNWQDDAAYYDVFTTLLRHLKVTDALSNKIR